MGKGFTHAFLTDGLKFENCCRYSSSIIGTTMHLRERRFITLLCQPTSSVSRLSLTIWVLSMGHLTPTRSSAPQMVFMYVLPSAFPFCPNLVLTFAACWRLLWLSFCRLGRRGLWTQTFYASWLSDRNNRRQCVPISLLSRLLLPNSPRSPDVRSPKHCNVPCQPIRHGVVK
jgi:hypothetical protein